MASIYRQFVEGSGDSFLFVTTNWDRVAERGLENMMEGATSGTIRAFHIHVAVDDHEGLYLPSEEAFEDYRSDQNGTGLSHFPVA